MADSPFKTRNYPDASTTLLNAQQLAKALRTPAERHQMALDREASRRKTPAKAAAPAPKRAGIKELGKSLSDLSMKKPAMKQGITAFVDRQQQAKELAEELE